MDVDRLACSVLLAMVVCLATTVTARGDQEPGRTLYRRYCAACHGPAGRGDGPVASALGQRPTDLTQIARRHGGEFPFLETVRAIDGSQEVRAHGVSEMPVWGQVLHAEPTWNADDYATARGRIVLITDYLESIQAR